VIALAYRAGQAGGREKDGGRAFASWAHGVEKGHLFRARNPLRAVAQKPTISQLGERLNAVQEAVNLELGGAVQGKAPAG
jgi:hypothetical protein